MSPRKDTSKSKVDLKEAGASGTSAKNPVSQESLRKVKSLVDECNKILRNRGIDGTLRRLDTFEKVPVVSSGSLALDKALGGGFGVGRVVEIYGQESSGKTTIALNAIRKVQESGKMALFIDAEQAFDPQYAQSLGVDLSNLLFLQESSAEAIFEIIKKMTEDEAVGIIVLDSIASIITEEEMSAPPDKQTIGLMARFLSRQLRDVVLRASKSKTTVIFLNQTREKIGVMFGNPETTTGGNALKFYATQRIRTSVKKADKIIVGENQVGADITFSIIKNKIGAPGLSGSTRILYSKGVDSSHELIDSAPNYCITKLSDNSNTYVEVETGYVLSAGGKEKAKERLRTDPEMLQRCINRFASEIERARDNRSLAEKALYADEIEGFTVVPLKEQSWTKVDPDDNKNGSRKNDVPDGFERDGDMIVNIETGEVYVVDENGEMVPV